MQAVKLYTSCYDTPMSAFISCVVDENYNALVVSGNPTPEQIQSAWDGIYEQYSELSKNTVYSEYVQRLKEHTIVLHQINGLTAGLTALRFAWYPDVANALRSLGFQVPASQPIGKKYFELLDGLSRQLSGLHTRLKMLDKMMQDSVKNQQGKAAKRSDFIRAASVMSKFMGFRVDLNDLTVAEYIEYQNQMVEYSRKQTKK